MPIYIYKAKDGSTIEVLHSIKIFDDIKSGRYNDIPEDIKLQIFEEGKPKERVLTTVNLLGFDKMGRS